jgi:hypothetical protein
VNIPTFGETPIEGVEGAAPAPSEFKSFIQVHSDGGYEILSRLAVNIDGLELVSGTDLEVLSRNRIAISSLEGPTMAHQPKDPTLQRMIEAANRVIG